MSLSVLLENPVEDLRALSTIFSSSYPAPAFRHLQQSHMLELKCHVSAPLALQALPFSAFRCLLISHAVHHLEFCDLESKVRFLYNSTIT